MFQEGSRQGRERKDMRSDRVMATRLHGLGRELIKTLAFILRWEVTGILTRGMT